jgi:hypothetical protein
LSAGISKKQGSPSNLGKIGKLSFVSYSLLKLDAKPLEVV